jgi:DNA replication protein DnaC
MSHQKTNAKANNPHPQKPPSETSSLRAAILDDFSALRLPISGDDLDDALREAESQGLSPLAFLRRVISEQARGRRERAIERRIREARFGDIQTLEEFNWEFNATSIDRVQIEALATGEFVRRRDNWVLLGRSGIGKSQPPQYTFSYRRMRG